MKERRYIRRAYLVTWLPSLILLAAGGVVPLMGLWNATAAAGSGRAAYIKPMYIAIAMGLSVPVFWFLWNVKRRRRLELQIATNREYRLPCLNCGYTLMLTELRCPECGAEIERRVVLEEWRRFRKWALMPRMLE